MVLADNRSIIDDSVVDCTQHSGRQWYGADITFTYTLSIYAIT